MPLGAAKVVVVMSLAAAWIRPGDSSSADDERFGRDRAPERETAGRGRYSWGMGEIAHVRLSGDVEGAFVITEKRPGGELVLAPDTSWKAILERTGSREASGEEIAAFESEHGPFLPPDGEG